MEFKAASAPGASHRTDAFVLFVPESANGTTGLAVPDAALARAGRAALAAKEFSGKADDTLLLHGGREGRRLLLAGLGQADGLEPLRRAAGAAARTLDRRGVRHATMLVPKGKHAAASAARAMAEGAGLALYRFDRLKSGKQRKRKLDRVTLAPVSGSAAGFKRAVREGCAIVEAVSFARDLGNLPGNKATAAHLAKRARALAGGKLRVRIHDRAGIRRLRMGAFGAVAQGSRNEPRLIEMRYRGAGSGKPDLALVGKGVTFDTGGISIKPSAKLEEMKFDMCGGAAVLGLMHLVAALEPRINLLALVPATDNMPDGSAYRPGDIVKARNGKTIEIVSTDAEGRLLLCDALAYAAEKKPRYLVDLATLTGACVVALGDAAAGLFANDDTLRRALDDAGERCGERLWPLPLFPRYTEMMKGTYADLKNGGGRWGGACTAAAFLKEFVGGTAWAHVDIAGTAWTDRDAGYTRKGATGFGVRLLWELLEQVS